MGKGNRIARCGRRLGDLIWGLPGYAKAVLAALIFGSTEGSVKSLLDHMSLDTYLLARASIAFAMLLVWMQWRARGDFYRTGLNPRSVRPLAWLRGLAFVTCTVMMTIGLVKNHNQMFAYATFLIHPAVTLLLMQLKKNERGSFLQLVGPLAITVVSAVAYALHGWQHGGVWDMMLWYVAPAIGGICFAGENALSGEMDRWYQYDALEVTFYTAFPTLVFTLVICAGICGWNHGACMRLDMQNWEDLEAILKLIAFSLVAPFAAVLLNDAFANAMPEQKPGMAALDLLILPYAAVVGLFTHSVTFFYENPKVPALWSGDGVLLLFILIGAVATVCVIEKIKLKTKQDGKTVSVPVSDSRAPD
ncbi:hypothetical protein [Caballeronia sp. TF1N1]|uniref:hypothetical protein n=1 Tax=Caballeronia sp. TF1N1 TaxID=2878153 RepID=UPI001FD0CBC1|nr:hypothetical protein [Caballeronia sp. TF1N1]